MWIEEIGIFLAWLAVASSRHPTPQLRVEYQRDFQGRGDATLSYADLSGGPFYRTGQSAFDRNRLMVGIDAALLTEQGLSTRLKYRGITDGDSGNDQTWMINLEKKY
ncbi:autotransporter domain-containing protein [Xanthomonas sp. 3793]|uniref:autotransporter domain-containing protein n=1 Tax=Xanthomonas sp. 3793 TaxID=3035312 RepID=UPI002169A93D|nr:autotransporter domain-containing protein [Xanthomonas sp. 3793]